MWVRLEQRRSQKSSTRTSTSNATVTAKASELLLFTRRGCNHADARMQEQEPPLQHVLDPVEILSDITCTVSSKRRPVSELQPDLKPDR